MFIDGQGHSSGVPVYLLNSRCEQCELFHIWCTADVTVTSESCKRLKYPSLFSCQLSPVLPVTYCTTRLLLLLFSCTHLRATNGDLPEKNLFSVPSKGPLKSENLGPKMVILK